ncbi:MAG: LysR family transcriptional regulator [Zoogloea sp.]|nr:LysR family transcriptional regulator [Zoogloea sp.]
MKKQRIEALWGHVHWLGVLAEAGSYTGAAARLGVSKAAVSQRIRELELAAGVPLVRRTTRSLRLTEAGQGLVEATREAFVQIERSFAGVRELADTPRGLLRVTAPVALGRQHIVPLVPAFLRAYPELSIELDLSAQISSLARDGFDVAIRHVFQGSPGSSQVSLTPSEGGLGEALLTGRSQGNAGPPQVSLSPSESGLGEAWPRGRSQGDAGPPQVSLPPLGGGLGEAWPRGRSFVPETHVAWTLCETRSVLVASPDYLQRRGAPADPQALAGHDCLGYRRAGGVLSWRFEPAGGGAQVSVPIRGCFAANNSEALREAAIGGLGLAVLSDFTAQRALLDGLLVPVLPDWRPVGLFGDSLCAIRPYSPTVPKAVQVFVAWLREALKEGFPLPR